MANPGSNCCHRHFVSDDTNSVNISCGARCRIVSPQNNRPPGVRPPIILTTAVTLHAHGKTDIGTAAQAAAPPNCRRLRRYFSVLRRSICGITCGHCPEVRNIPTAAIAIRWNLIIRTIVPIPDSANVITSKIEPRAPRRVAGTDL